MILEENHNTDLHNSPKHEGNPKECCTYTMRIHVGQNLAVLLLELFVFVIQSVLVDANAGPD
jgi:hypothetical protein